MPERKQCQARQESDQKRCDRCGLIWDMNDPEPPECLTDIQISRQRGRLAIKQIRENLNHEQFNSNT